ncbi:hypothetical protein AAFF_G00255130 [Aldrovandia affinis]|uniref:Uncharacterized protein n=1 Tax=Aldrovandia affinis TaxID=143900 RepID=A0AAD7RCP1_9TELE|nr:hypothetical protein AAFF_G00255130 [Aldrovandia affinis]
MASPHSWFCGWALASSSSAPSPPFPCQPASPRRCGPLPLRPTTAWTSMPRPTSQWRSRRWFRTPRGGWRGPGSLERRSGPRPPGQEPAEVPQIKGPVEIPNKEEEVQLDRPDAGVAVADGEAHRHEPPIPHDRVMVDVRKDQEELQQEGKRPAQEEEGPAQEVKRPAQKEEGPAQEAEESEQGAGHAQEADRKGGEGQVAERANEVIEKPAANEKVPEPPPYKDVENPPPDKVHAGKADERVALKPEEGVKAAEQPAEKRAPVAPGPELQKRAEGPQAQKNLEAKDPAAEDKMEEGQLDHAVLLQVIKEQQEQQKRLLDQQEKLLAVIQEQHKEIHQEQRPADMAPEAGGRRCRSPRRTLLGARGPGQAVTTKRGAPKTQPPNPTSQPTQTRPSMEGGAWGRGLRRLRTARRGGVWPSRTPTLGWGPGGCLWRRRSRRSPSRTSNRPPIRSCWRRTGSTRR